MAAPDTTKYQANFKLADGTLINLYATDVKDFEIGLTDLSMVASLIKSTSEELGGGSVTAQAVAAITQSFPSAAPVAAPAGAAPSCRHGVMNLRSGTNARGPWSGYMCAGPKELPKEQKCDTIWAR